MLEGIDGAGKTEQSRRLAEWLGERGHSVVETREPTDGPWGRRYRAWARGDFEAAPTEVLNFFVEDRREHIEAVIEPALEKGEIVICDRYIHSTLAYQAAAGLDRQMLAEMFNDGSFPKPDLILWLRLPVLLAMERMGQAATERFEHSEFLDRVDEEYARLEGLQVVDASREIEQVQRGVRECVERLLG